MDGYLNYHRELMGKTILDKNNIEVPRFIPFAKGMNAKQVFKKYKVIEKTIDEQAVSSLI